LIMLLLFCYIQGIPCGCIFFKPISGEEMLTLISSYTEDNSKRINNKWCHIAEELTRESYIDIYSTVSQAMTNPLECPKQTDSLSSMYYKPRSQHHDCSFASLKPCLDFKPLFQRGIVEKSHL
jgi:hypothetical protein